MARKKLVKIKAVADDSESLEWLLSELDHLTNIPSRILVSGNGGYHVFVDVVVE